MLICKYKRVGNASFVPHLDTLRAVVMGIRRIGVKAEYSEGFNPHMKIFFGQPLPIGTESECEYFCAYVNEEPNEFAEKLNKSLPSGLQITAAARAEKDPNVAKIMCFADYTVTMRGKVDNLREVESFAELDECVISYEQKGELVKKDVKPLISFLRVCDERTVKLRLSCGNKNLRADRLTNSLCKTYGITCGYDIIKTNMYDCNFVDLDTILLGSCN